MRVSSMVLNSSDLSEPIGFSLSSVDPTNQYLVKNIIGLDAEDITPKFYGFSLHTKSRFYNFSLKPREIVLRVALNPRYVLGESYSDVRDQLYKAISATRTGLINLQFLAGGSTIAQLWGSISKFEASYFGSVPEVQLTIRCSDPLFRAINPVDYAPGEFPTANPVHIPDSLSTAPHGFEMIITFTDNPDTFQIRDTFADYEWLFRIEPAGGFEIGDVLHLGSEFSNKYLYVMRGSTKIFLMESVVPGSIWPILFPGDNQFYFFNIGDFTWNDLKYYPAYWGV